MANFRNAHLQFVRVMDAAVSGPIFATDASNTAAAKAFLARQQAPDASTLYKVGDMVTLTPATATLPASIKRTLSLATATHIIAQSDVQLEYGHIPVENRDYRYFPMVNGTYTGTLAAATPVKKIALFKIDDKTDVIIDASQGETV